MNHTEAIKEFQIFDTHAHFNDEAYDADRAEALAQVLEAGVGHVTEIGYDMASSRAAVALAHAYPHVYAAVGVHPDNVGELKEEDMDELVEMARDPKVVAIGEIGLDYHWNVESAEVQKYWFRRQIQAARDAKKPVNVHSRDAAEDTMELIKDEKLGEVGGIVHCYSYSLEQAGEYVKMGLYLGVGGVVTYKNGRKLKQVVREIPLEHLVLETDCPYLAPTPHRGERNTSAYLPLMVQAISELKDIPEEEVIRITEENAKRVYGLL